MLARSYFVGDTSYAHQSFDDIIHDLIEIRDILEAVNNKIDNYVNKLDQSNYWMKVDDGFHIMVLKAQKFFETCISEIKDIVIDIQIEVKEHHIKRLQNLYLTSRKIEEKLSTIWNKDYCRKKDYDDENFFFVERLYIECHQMTLDMFDLSNMCPRLKDYLGMKKTEKQSIFDIKPELYGIKLNINEIFRRIFKRRYK